VKGIWKIDVIFVCDILYAKGKVIIIIQILRDVHLTIIRCVDEDAVMTHEILGILEVHVSITFLSDGELKKRNQSQHEFPICLVHFTMFLLAKSDESQDYQNQKSLSVVHSPFSLLGKLLRPHDVAEKDESSEGSDEKPPRT